jgi:predicted Zn-dependent peptidase
MRDDDPSDLVHDEFAAALFGDTPLGRPVLGTEESIRALTRRQVHGYYQRRYTPDSMVVAVAGNVVHSEVVALVRRAFADRLDESVSPSPVRLGKEPSGVPARSVAVIGDDTEQANILLGCQGLARPDRSRAALGVLSAALGGGMSSRLFQRIREERGLAYSVYSYTSAYADTGQFGVYAGCQPGKVDEVLTLMTAELDAVARGDLTLAEIERGKGQMRGSIVLGLEDAGARMIRIGKGELTIGDVIGVDELLGRIDAVTPDDLAAVAADVLGRPRCLTVVGPFDEREFAGAV